MKIENIIKQHKFIFPFSSFLWPLEISNTDVTFGTWYSSFFFFSVLYVPAGGISPPEPLKIPLVGSEVKGAAATDFFHDFGGGNGQHVTALCN